MLKVMPIVKTIMSSVFQKEATVAYPFAPLEVVPQMRGHVTIEIEDCIFCGICQKKCPTGTIEVKKDTKEWAISHYDCVQCRYCVDSCPKKCLHMSEDRPTVSETRTRETVKDARVPADEADHTDS